MSDDLDNDFSWLSDDDESDSPDTDWQDSDSDETDSGADDSRLGFTGELDWRRTSIDPDSDDDGDLLADLSKLRGQKAPEPDLSPDEPDDSPAEDELMEDIPDWMRDVSESDEYERPTVSIRYEGEVSDEIYERYESTLDDDDDELRDEDDDDFDDEIPDWILQGSMPGELDSESDDASGEESPDWLQSAAPDPKPMDDSPAWMRDDESDAEALFVDKDGDGIPDWMQGDAETDDALFVDKDGDGVPDWMQGDTETADEVAADAPVPDWIAAEPEPESEGMDDEDDEIPDWMHEEEPAFESSAEDAGFEPELEPSAGLFDEDEGDDEIPDWMHEEEPAFESSTEDAGFEPELEPSAGLFDEDEGDDEIPDWMHEEEPAFESSAEDAEFEPELEPSAGLFDEDESDDETPDWLAAGMAAYSTEPAADFDAGFAGDEDEDEVPDWIAQGVAPEPVEESPPDFDNLFGEEDFDVEDEGEGEFELLATVAGGGDELDNLLGSMADDDFDLLNQLTGGGTDRLIGGEDDPLASLLVGGDEESGSEADEFFADLITGEGNLTPPEDETSEQADDFTAFFDELDEGTTPELSEDDLLLASMSDESLPEADEDLSGLFGEEEPAEMIDAADYAASDELEAPPSAEAIEEAFTQFEAGADDDELAALFGDADSEDMAAEAASPSSIFDDDDEELNTFFTDYDDHDDQYEDWFGSIPQPESEAASGEAEEAADWLQEIEEIDEETLAEEMAALEETRADAADEAGDDEVEDDDLGWLDELPAAELPKPSIDLDADDLILEGDEDALGWLGDDPRQADLPEDDQEIEALATADDELMAGITSAVDSGQHKLDRLLEKLSKDDTLELPITGQLPTIDTLQSGVEFDSLMEDPSLAAMLQDDFGQSRITLSPDAPDWLVDLSQEAAGASSAAAIVRRRKERPLEELPNQLRDLRERALNLSAPTAQDLLDTALGSVLSGVNKTLVPQVIDPAVATSLVTALPLSQEQQERAQILQQVVSAGTLLTDKAPVEQAGWTRMIKAQTLVAVLMIAAMLLPFLIDSLEVGSLPPSAFTLGSRQDTFVSQIHRLEPGQLALIAVEYGPTGAAELDDATQSLLLHTIQRGAIPVIVGSNPVGMLRVRAMLDDIAAANSQQIRINRDYVLGRFIVGDAIGLRDLNENVKLLVSDDLDGVDTGLTIESLDEFSVIVVIAENAERVRLWGEQVKPETSTPILAITGQAAAPLSLPYVEANPNQIGGILIGYQDAYTYRTMIMDLLAGQINIDDIPPVETTEEPQALVTDEVIPPSETPQPTVQVAATFPAPDDLSMITVSGGATVNVYDQPDDSGEPVAILEPDDEALVLGTNVDSSWYSILLVESAIEGWIRAELVSAAEIEAAPSATVTPQPSNTQLPAATQTMLATSTPPPTATNTPPPTATPTVTASPTLTPTPTPSAVATEIVVEVAVVISSDSVNVRSGPGTSFSPVAVARPGEQALVLGTNANSTWYNILLESGIEGWISASLVRIEQYRATPEPGESVDLIEVGIVVSTDVVNIRSGPGTGFSAVATLRPGDQVTIIGRTADETWYNVRLQNGVEGWIAAFLLRIELITPDEGASSGFKMDQATVHKQSVNLKRLPAQSQGAEESTPTQEGDTPGAVSTQVSPALPTIAASLTPSGPATDLGGPDGGRVLLAPVEDKDNYRDERWYSMNIGIIAAVLIIMTGNVLSLIRALLRRRRDRG
jgi:uncharacterized protein YgiM (DUF1202 family)